MGNGKLGNFPSEHQITQALIHLREDWLATMEEGDPDDLDVRLQVIPSESMDWTLHMGDAQYDTDHRGFWGAAVIDANMTTGDLRSVAGDLIEQAEEMAAQGD